MSADGDDDEANGDDEGQTDDESDADLGSTEDEPDGDDVNKRFLAALSYFSDWAKHIITLSAGLLVLSATFLHDIVVSSEAMFRTLAGIALAVAYVALLLAVWRALRFISFSAGTILAEGPVIASGDELEQLQRLLRQTQGLFFGGLTAFAMLAIVSLVSWVVGAGSPDGG